MIGSVLRQVHIAYIFIAQLALGQRVNHSCDIHLSFRFTLLSNESYDAVNNALCQGTVDVVIIRLLVLAWHEMS
jgi:hypothetical protein